MAFWFGILIAALFAWLAVSTSFYDMWGTLFNMTVSIYLAVFCAPLIIELIPAADSMRGGHALTVAALAIFSFAILHGLTYVMLLAHFQFSFPKILDFLAAGLLGFLAGLLLWSFVGMLIMMSPVAQNKFVKGMGFDESFKQTNISYLCWWCDIIHNRVATDTPDTCTEDAVKKLLAIATESSESAQPSEPIPHYRTLDPNQPPGPNPSGLSD